MDVEVVEEDGDTEDEGVVEEDEEGVCIVEEEGEKGIIC